MARREGLNELAGDPSLNPDRFNVVVASNLFGDILSDLGPACAGTIGIAPSGNINPESKFPSVFEPVHGSAPDIAGQGITNPIGQIWSGAMMLDHLGESDAARAIVGAIERTLAEPKLRTLDLKGAADTVTCGKAIADALGDYGNTYHVSGPPPDRASGGERPRRKLSRCVEPRKQSSRSS
jgi:tartrate dehydrogenase/decarboxylase/D-malate dehydrogenase